MSWLVRRWKLVLGTIVIIAAAGAYYYLVGGVTPVQTVSPAAKAVEAVITEDGSVIPQHKAVVAAPVAGRIVELQVEVGDVVHAGDLVAQLDQEEGVLSVRALEAQLASARAAYDRARKGATAEEIAAQQAQVDAAKAQVAGLDRQVDEARLTLNSGKLSYNEYARLVESRKAAQAELDATVAQLEQLKQGATQETLRQLQAQVNETEARLAQAQLQVQRSDLRSPMDGTILERPVEVGAVVAPGTVVAMVGDTNDLLVESYVLAADSVRVKDGQEVRITGDVLQGQTIEGTVQSVAAVAVTRQSELGALQERVRVVVKPSAQVGLKSGYGVDVEIVTASEASALTVPPEAVFQENGKDYVLVVVDGTVEQREVNIGIRSDTAFQVLSGISESDQVILNPSPALTEGSRVRTQ